MMSIAYDKKTKRVLLVAIILGLVSLVLPWWNLVFLQNGQLLAYFGSHLWWVMRTGFYRSDLSYEWWSYATLILVGTGCVSHLFGYRLLKTSRKTAMRLVLLGIAITLAGCVFYPVSLSYAFPKYSSSTSFYNLWIIVRENGVYTSIVTYSLFSFSYVSSTSTLFFEFLSVGFFLALVSSVLSLIALIRLKRSKSPVRSPNSTESRTRSVP